MKSRRREPEPARVPPWALGGVALVSLAFLAVAARAADGDVRVSSIGYLAARAKHLTVQVPAGSASLAFTVRRASDDGAAFTGTLGAAAADTATTDVVAVGDFSALTDSGSFYVDVPGIGRSVTFPVGDDVTRGPYAAAMLGFLGSRCGAEVSLDYAGQIFGHGACHAGDGLLDYLGTAGASRDGTHGWHDAGDYGKYTSNGAFTVGMLLDAWERHGDTIRLQPISVPEAVGSLAAPWPPFLAEVKWELDWLLSMQYGDSFGDSAGRVSHKLTALAFEAFIAPEDDASVRYFVPYSTAATADFVAAMAEASRVFAPFDAVLGARYLSAARSSYAYLLANTANVAADQAAFTTGGYGSTDPDDRLWAAAEMWETTGDAAALADVEARIGALTMTVVDADFDWGNVKNLGLFTYLRSARAGRNATTVARVRTSALAAADAVVAAHDGSRYGRGVTRFYWGSNGGVARTAMVLDLAHELTGDAKYLDAAMDQLAYLFGRNHYNRSQVTGVGIAPPLTPHHRPSASDDVSAPYPGLLVGGGTTATNWVDDQAMYMVNEVAVNWNGALVYALGMFLPATALPPPPDGGVGGTGVGGSGPGGSHGGTGGAGPVGSGADAGVTGLGAAPGTKSGASGCGCDLGGGAAATRSSSTWSWLAGLFAGGCLLARAPWRRRRRRSR